jgi:hypothetical protein
MSKRRKNRSGSVMMKLSQLSESTSNLGTSNLDSPTVMSDGRIFAVANPNIMKKNKFTKLIKECNNS